MDTRHEPRVIISSNNDYKHCKNTSEFVLAALQIGSKPPFWSRFFTTRSSTAKIPVMECWSNEKEAQHPNTPVLQYSGQGQQSML
jgi:hypothetical protein